MTPDPEACDVRLARWRARTEAALETCLPPARTRPERLHEAMRYAVLGGGKRLRPLLVYAAGAAFGVAEEVLDAPACAVELIHAYSLVHDDLPCMDDDDLRRGRASCHIAFDEATALLAGDALQSLAFHTLAQGRGLAPDLCVRMIETLALASGSRGMAGGQALDLAATGRTLDPVELESMHIHKTGALIRASVMLGALAANGLSDTTRARLDHFGKCVGLAFQIQDDILDVTGERADTGKRPGKDQARGKPTYTSVLGLAGARDKARALEAEAASALDDLARAGHDAAALRSLTRFVVERNG